jgi:hypothetical protein
MGADRLIAGLTGLAGFEAAWIDILAPPKERAEQGDFRFQRGALIDHPMMSNLESSDQEH